MHGFPVDGKRFFLIERHNCSRGQGVGFKSIEQSGNFAVPRRRVFQRYACLNGFDNFYAFAQDEVALLFLGVVEDLFPASLKFCENDIFKNRPQIFCRIEADFPNQGGVGKVNLLGVCQLFFDGKIKFPDLGNEVGTLKGFNVIFNRIGMFEPDSLRKRSVRKAFGCVTRQKQRKLKQFAFAGKMVSHEDVAVNNAFVERLQQVIVPVCNVLREAADLQKYIQLGIQLGAAACRVKIFFRDGVSAKFQKLGKREREQFVSNETSREAGPEFPAKHGRIRPRNENLVARIDEAANKTLPAGDVLDFVEVKRVLLAEKLNKYRVKQGKIFDAKPEQAFIVEVEKKILFATGLTDLPQQSRFAATANSRNDQNLRSINKRLRNRTRNYRRRSELLPLVKNNLSDNFVHSGRKKIGEIIHCQRVILFGGLPNCLGMTTPLSPSLVFLPPQMTPISTDSTLGKNIFRQAWCTEYTK